MIKKDVAVTGPVFLTEAQFQQLADVPPAMTWFANNDSPETRRAYQNDVEEFMAFAGIVNPDAFRLVARAHVLAWRRDLEQRGLGGATIRRKLAALSSMFESLCEANAIQGNPVDGVKRPKMTAMKAKPRPLATSRRVRYSQRRMRRPCAASVIARCWPPCFIMACAAPNFARCA